METSGNRTALGVSADVAQLIGNRLRRARESIGRSTSALSAKIKVREHYLVAIEDGQWNELPPGLNGRGLVRIYARELSVSVPELDQAANPSVMPAEHDAQAPYQVTQKREQAPLDRNLASVRTMSGGGSQAPRATETSSRTNTLSSAQRSGRVNNLMPVLDIKRSSTTTPSFKSIESNPEEEPLDVVTPDVASILGITLETLEEAPNPKRAAAAAAVPVQQVVSPVIDPPVQHNERTNADGKIANLEALSRALPSSHQNEEMPLVLPEVTAEPAAVKEEQVALPPHRAEEQPTDSAPAQNSSPSLGVDAAQTYLKSHAAQDAPLSEPEVNAKISVGQPTRWAIGLVAASVVALVVGQVFMRPDTPASDVSSTNASGNESTQAISEGAPQENPESVSVETNVSSELPQALTVDAAAEMPPETEQAVAAATEPRSQPDDSAIAADAVNPVAQAEVARAGAAATVESAQPEVAAGSTSQTVTPMSGASAAVLTLSEPLEIQITADGKRIFSGKHNAGKLEIKFNRRAEIFVQDGSKARLKYAGWDHGTLGLSGRKRRIVLNAEKFGGSAN